jgi:DNA-binding MarR family transcriptional regulator
MVEQAELLEQVIWELRRLFRELAAVADRELRPIGLNTGDRALLELLSRERKPISLSDLARKYSVSRQHIHQSLRRLPRRAWVERKADPTDSRSVLLHLSPEGRAKWKQIRRLDRAFLNQLAHRVSRNQLASTSGMLRQLRRELSLSKELPNERH